MTETVAKADGGYVYVKSLSVKDNAARHIRLIDMKDYELEVEGKKVRSIEKWASPCESAGSKANRD